MAMRPHAVEFADIVLGDEEIALSIEDQVVSPNSKMDGATLAECITPESANYMIIAVRRQGEELELVPPPSTVISARDVLVVLGTRDQFQELKSLTAAPAD